MPKIHTPRVHPIESRGLKSPPRIPWVRLSLVLGSAGGFGFYTLYYFQSYLIALRKPLPSAEEIATVNASLADTWKQKKRVNEVDSDLEWDEWWSGITKKRRELVGQARGQVLESAVGTGRNVGLYDPEKVTGFTLVDQSQAMLDVCRAKWKDEKLQNGLATAKFLVGDLGRDEVGKVLRHGQFEAGDDEESKFDTVVQTMGLCSTPDPVKFLNNLGQVVKQDGKILLLEHGKGHHNWLNQLLERTSLAHAKEHGCWWDRDIGAIVEQSDLRVEEIKRYNFGTLWWIILRPQERAKEIPAAVSDERDRKSRWWDFW